LSIGTLDDWKIATVKPIKKGSSFDPNNYRQNVISLTSVVCKLFEAILKTNLVGYLENHSLLSASQHGFRHSRSTDTIFLHSINSWMESLECKSPVKILRVDFVKAFDTVSIPKLLYKLDRYGIKEHY